MAADLVVFDPDTVAPVKEDVVHDFPANGWRMRELAEGIHYTVGNGEVLLEKGEHTGSHPGRVLRNARYQTTRNGGGQRGSRRWRKPRHFSLTPRGRGGRAP